MYICTRMCIFYKALVNIKKNYQENVISLRDRNALQGIANFWRKRRSLISQTGNSISQNASHV